MNSTIKYKYMTVLVNESFENIENFISDSNNKCKTELGCCLNVKDADNATTYLSKIRSEPIGTYYTIGSSGYRTYGYYKNSESKIYLISLYLQDFDYFIEI